MTSRKSTKRALILSCISMLLCVSMLVGSTFAWFTDTDMSSGNKIEAGTLKVELWEGNTNLTNTSAPVFTSANWEPGYSDYTDLTLKNTGDLALKYQVLFQNIVPAGDADITEVLDVFVGDKKVGTLKALGTTYALANGSLEKLASVNLDRITVKMQEQAGNKYQGCSVTFDILVRAIQFSSEFDGFGNPDYDYSADGKPDHPEFDFTITGVSAEVKVPADHTGSSFTYSNGDNTVKVTIPSATANDTYNITANPTDNTSTVTVNSNQGTKSFDITVTKDGAAVPSIVELTTDTGMPNVELFHDGAAMTAVSSVAEVDSADEFYYDAATGKLTMYLASYSNFTLRYEYRADIGGVRYGSLAEALAAAQNGDTVKLLTDVSECVTVDGKNLTLDMNNKSIDCSNVANSYVLTAKNNAVVTVTGNGAIKAGKGGDGEIAVFADSGATVNILNGTYSVGADKDGKGNSTVYAKGEGTLVNIAGGTFSTAAAYHDFWYVLNCKNETGANIQVTGGTFVNYNPAVGDDTGTPPSFLAIGYKSVASGNTYTVQPADFFKNADGKWEIRTAAGLTEFAEKVNSGSNYAGETIILGCNIDLKNQDWEPIGQTIAIHGNSQAYNFLGTFDGQNYTISNLNVDSDAETHGEYASGLFGFLDVNGSVKNLKIDGATVKGHHWTAAVCGYTAKGSIENCHVTNATIISTHANSDACGDKTGAVIGYTTGTVKDCTATNCSITIDGRDAGQIAGAAKEANVTNCTATNVTVKAVENLTCTNDSKGTNIREEVIGRLLNP